MKVSLSQWIKNYRAILTNSGSMIGTWVSTSGLGFAYWWLAARIFPPEAVGLGSAANSAMMLLGTLSVLGLDTLLIGELSRKRGRAFSLICTALLVVGIVGTITGFFFALVAPLLSANLAPIQASPLDTILFALGVGLTAMVLVLDQALIGLLWGGLQLWRNVLFSVIKLGTLLLAGIWLAERTGMAIYTTWLLGNAFSLLILALFWLVRSKHSWRLYRPEWGQIMKLKMAALQHHLLNLTLHASPLVLPVIVTILISTQAAGWYYIASMLAGIVDVVPLSLVTVLFATASAQPGSLARQIRLTLALSFIVVAVANICIFAATKPILGLFGDAYAHEAEWCLRFLSLEAFPLIIKDHFVAVHRIERRLPSATVVMIAATLFEIAAAAFGAYVGGLTGLAICRFASICIVSVIMFPPVYRAVRFGFRGITGELPQVQDATWEVTQRTDTSPSLPVLVAWSTSRGVPDWPISELDTQPLPAVQMARSVSDELLGDTLKLPVTPPGQLEENSQEAEPSELEEQLDKTVTVMYPRINPGACRGRSRSL